MHSNYSYESALAASDRVNWKVEDIIGGEKTLDFSKAFLPESLAQVNGISFLTPVDRITSYNVCYTKLLRKILIGVII